MELGGNKPAIVMPTANLDDAAEGIIQSAFSMSGQLGSACSRVYVHRDIHGDFMESLIIRLSQRKIGLPTQPDTFMGPLINASAMTTFQQAVQVGKRDGRIVYGGNTLDEDEFAHGHFVEPTVIDRTRHNSSLLSKEYLVPVLAVAEIRSMEEALGLANASPYGLSAGIYTQVDGEQELFFDQIEAGTAFCNRRQGATSGSYPGHQSTGGWKGSGSTGKNSQGPYYLTQFMREQSRTVCW
jgi:1-pyrroline-5-carboxylate dehydrogenase